MVERLVRGMLIVVSSGMAIFQGSQGSSQALTFYGATFLYFIGILAAYIGVYWILGERVLAKSNPWINTAILVAPAFTIAWWNLAFLPVTGFPIPPALSLAMGVYIGLSFILQWRIKYGGCEVVALPILLFKRRYTTYCVPLVALDAVEKKISNRTA